MPKHVRIGGAPVTIDSEPPTPPSRQLPPYRGPKVESAPVQTAPSPEQHRAATLELRVPLLGLAAVIVALGAGGGGAAVSKFWKDEKANAQELAFREQSQAEDDWQSECLLHISRSQVEIAEYLRRSNELSSAMFCRAGVRARGMRCNTVEFEAPANCPRGKVCPQVWRTDADWPSLPDVRACSSPRPPAKKK